MRNLSQGEADRIDAQHNILMNRITKVLKIILFLEVIMLPVLIKVYGGEKSNDEFAVRVFK